MRKVNRPTTRTGWVRPAESCHRRRACASNSRHIEKSLTRKHGSSACRRATSMSVRPGYELCRTPAKNIACVGTDFHCSIASTGRAAERSRPSACRSFCCKGLCSFMVRMEKTRGAYHSPSHTKLPVCAPRTTSTSYATLNSVIRDISVPPGS